ncbi:MAG TPA: pitrilysin family protein [Casimicrobiaceae bacterium]|nr:pitrilysin family protein [Casimicrobiaceae bacterium]
MTGLPQIAPDAGASAPAVTTLGNGVRVVVVHAPHLATAAVSVFVRSGSDHEPAHLHGISHVIEHMAFKGTRSRSCQEINLDAERLGAEVNAHTDKDHTAFHMVGRARDAPAFVRMLGDIVTQSTFPEGELARERQVLLHELADEEDDPLGTAFELFDGACFGDHPAGRRVIGTAASLRRVRRADLVAHVENQYTGVNTLVAIAGNVDRDAVVAAAQHAFGAMRPGTENRIDPPRYVGGVRARRLAGSTQAHVVLGFGIPAREADHEAYLVAAALFGEGMSSPLLDELRERRGLVYHADCSADVRGLHGQFVVEASTMPQNVPTYVAEVWRLLHEHATTTDLVGLERARNQIAVRILLEHEHADERLEQVALDLLARGRIRTPEERLARIDAIGPDDVRQVFATMLEAGAAVGLAGAYARGEEGRIADLLAGHPAPARRTRAGAFVARRGRRPAQE